MTQLMTNNERTREQALKLNEEVGRLRKRETELTKRIQALLNQRDEKSQAEKEFLDWLVLFRTESEEPSKSSVTEPNNKERIPTIDPRTELYVDDDRDMLDLAKVNMEMQKLIEELRFISKVKRKGAFSWLVTRQSIADDNIAKWEHRMGLTLPLHLSVLLKAVGENPELKLADFAKTKHILAYSPLLALLPLDEIGWTEIWSGDDEPDTYLDDPQTNKVLERFDAGHEFDDSFVCEQLCGKDFSENTQRVQVLLVGAPLDIRQRNGSIINSRMFLNIRPNGKGGFDGDGLLYRFDCTITRDESDSDLVKIGKGKDWIQESLVNEVEDRFAVAGENDPIVKRHAWVLNRKRGKQSQDAAQSTSESASSAT